MKTNTPRPERYRAKVDRRGPDDCWPWTACRNQFGYGHFNGGTVNGKREQLAHRYGYIIEVGPIPDGMNVCHHCDNPPCQNPAHWFLGDPHANSADKVAKGRHRWGPQVGTVNSRALLTEDDVREIRRLHSAGMTQRPIADRYSINQSAVSKIVARVNWSHVD